MRLEHARWGALSLVASSLVTSGVSRADATASGSELPESQRSVTEALEESTSPIPTTTQLSFEPGYRFPNGQDRYLAQLLFESLVPYDGFLVPDLIVHGFRSVARMEVSGVSLERRTPAGAISASGLSDLFFVDGVVHDFGSLEVGMGVSAVFPLATSPVLGQGKLQLGPTALVAVLDVPWLQLGILGQAVWSIAGDNQRASLAYATVQPLVTVLLPGECSVFTNETMSFYWKGSQSSLPIALGFGHGFSEHFVGQIQSVYIVSGSGKGSLTAQLVLNFQP
jgi:hypothetical protein